MIRFALRLAGTAIVATGLCSFAAAEEPPLPPRQIMLEKPMELPANKLNARVSKVVLPRGYKTPLHTHDGPGPRYVVRGKVKIDEGGQVREYGPGQVYLETGQWVSAENVGDGEAEVLMIELAVPK